jgi:hypothetical protein
LEDFPTGSPADTDIDDAVDGAERGYGGILFARAFGDDAAVDDAAVDDAAVDDAAVDDAAVDDDLMTGLVTGIFAEVFFTEP